MAEQKEILESIRDVLSGKDDDVFDLTQKVNDDGSITQITPKHKEPQRIEPVLNLPKDEPIIEKAPEPVMPEVVAENTDDILSEIDSILNSKPADEKVELEFPLKAEPKKFEIAEEFEAPKPAKEPDPNANIMPRPENKEAQMDNENITADDAKNSISELMGKLKNQGKEVERSSPSTSFRSGATMEDLVAEMLKPMMKDWLDNNLPKLVKETVQKEIQKLIPKE